MAPHTSNTSRSTDDTTSRKLAVFTTSCIHTNSATTTFAISRHSHATLYTLSTRDEQYQNLQHFCNQHFNKQHFNAQHLNKHRKHVKHRNKQLQRLQHKPSSTTRTITSTTANSTSSTSANSTGTGTSSIAQLHASLLPHHHLWRLLQVLLLLSSW
jgi:hypothetical protein